jgi:hypothetical protein
MIMRHYFLGCAITLLVSTTVFAQVPAKPAIANSVAAASNPVSASATTIPARHGHHRIIPVNGEQAPAAKSSAAATASKAAALVGK